MVFSGTAVKYIRSIVSNKIQHKGSPVLSKCRDLSTELIAGSAIKRKQTLALSLHALYIIIEVHTSVLGTSQASKVANYIGIYELHMEHMIYIEFSILKHNER